MKINIMNKRKKAISPLIASVVLIVFTMSVAALLTTWVKSITIEQERKVTESEQEMNCFLSDIKIDSDFTKINNKTNPTLLSARIENTGSHSINLASYRIWDNDIEPDIWKITDDANISIKKNNALKIVLNITTIDSSFKKIKIQTECKGVYVVIEKPTTGWREDTTLTATNMIGATKE